MNQKTNTIKWLAIITMTIDHIGYFLFPSQLWLRIIGRLAFPLFLYTTIEGVQRTKNMNHYLLRLVVTGLISMIVTIQIGNPFNILFTLAIFAFSLEHIKLFPIALLLSNLTEYGIYGFLMGWGIYIMLYKNKWWGIVSLLVLHVFFASTIQSVTLLALIPILVKMNWRLPPLPKWLGYSYYPLHQLVLLLLTFIK